MLGSYWGPLLRRCFLRGLMSFFRWGVMSFWVPWGRAFSILEVYLAKVSDAVSRRWLRSGNDSPRNHLLGLWFGSILAKTMCDQILIFAFFQDDGLFCGRKKNQFFAIFLAEMAGVFFLFLFFYFFLFFKRVFFSVFRNFEISEIAFEVLPKCTLGVENACFRRIRGDMTLRRRGLFWFR